MQSVNDVWDSLPEDEKDKIISSHRRKMLRELRQAVEEKVDESIRSLVEALNDTEISW